MTIGMKRAVRRGLKGEEAAKLGYRIGLKVGLLMAWDAQPGDSVTCEIDGDSRSIDEWLEAADAGEFDTVAQEKGFD